MKNTGTYTVNYEKTIFAKRKKIWKVLHNICQLRKNLKYLNIQEILWSENVIEYQLCKGLFLYTLKYFRWSVQCSQYTSWLSMFNEATFREIFLPSSGNVNDYVTHI